MVGNVYDPLVFNFPISCGQTNMSPVFFHGFKEIPLTESHDGLPGDASAVRDLELPAGPFHDPVRRHDHPSNWIIFPQKHVHLQDAR